jgi:hypothetical protein
MKGKKGKYQNHWLRLSYWVNGIAGFESKRNAERVEVGQKLWNSDL